jgi:hypothetical protein
MTTEEQLVIAIETLRRLADEENMNKAAASMSRFGSAGAGMAYGDVQKYAAETLAKMGVGLLGAVPQRCERAPSGTTVPDLLTAILAASVRIPRVGCVLFGCSPH